jgi:TolA-binding protein
METTMRYAAVFCVALAACSDVPTDPSEGGFIAGVSGIASGAYDDRVEAKEADVAAARERNAQLESQIRASESELSRLKLRILEQRRAIPQSDRATANRVDRVLRSQPSGNSDSAKLASLQQAIADARALSADLAKLGAG